MRDRRLPLVPGVVHRVRHRGHRHGLRRVPVGRVEFQLRHVRGERGPFRHPHRHRHRAALRLAGQHHRVGALVLLRVLRPRGVGFRQGQGRRGHRDAPLVVVRDGDGSPGDAQRPRRARDAQGLRVVVDGVVRGVQRELSRGAGPRLRNHDVEVIDRGIVRAFGGRVVRAAHRHHHGRRRGVGGAPVHRRGHGHGLVRRGFPDARDVRGERDPGRGVVVVRDRHLHRLRGLPVVVRVVRAHRVRDRRLSLVPRVVHRVRHRGHGHGLRGVPVGRVEFQLRHVRGERGPFRHPHRHRHRAALRLAGQHHRVGALVLLRVLRPRGVGFRQGQGRRGHRDAPLVVVRDGDGSPGDAQRPRRARDAQGLRVVVDGVVRGVQRELSRGAGPRLRNHDVEVIDRGIVRAFGGRVVRAAHRHHHGRRRGVGGAPVHRRGHGHGLVRRGFPDARDVRGERDPGRGVVVVRDRHLHRLRGLPVVVRVVRAHRVRDRRLSLVPRVVHRVRHRGHGHGLRGVPVGRVEFQLRHVRGERGPFRHPHRHRHRAALRLAGQHHRVGLLVLLRGRRLAVVGFRHRQGRRGDRDAPHVVVRDGALRAAATLSDAHAGARVVGGKRRDAQNSQEGLVRFVDVVLGGCNIDRFRLVPARETEGLRRRDGGVVAGFGGVSVLVGVFGGGHLHAHRVLRGARPSHREADGVSLGGRPARDREAWRIVVVRDRSGGLALVFRDFRGLAGFAEDDEEGLLVRLVEGVVGDGDGQGLFRVIRGKAEGLGGRDRGEVGSGGGVRVVRCIERSRPLHRDRVFRRPAPGHGEGDAGVFLGRGVRDREGRRVVVLLDLESEIGRVRDAGVAGDRPRDRDLLGRPQVEVVVVRGDGDRTGAGGRARGDRQGLVVAQGEVGRGGSFPRGGPNRNGDRRRGGAAQFGGHGGDATVLGDGVIVQLQAQVGRLRQGDRDRIRGDAHVVPAADAVGDHHVRLLGQRMGGDRDHLGGIPIRGVKLEVERRHAQQRSRRDARFDADLFVRTEGRPAAEPDAIGLRESPFDT